MADGDTPVPAPQQLPQLTPEQWAAIQKLIPQVVPASVETFWEKYRAALMPVVLAIVAITGFVGVRNGWWTAEEFQEFRHTYVNQQTGEVTTVTTKAPAGKSPAADSAKSAIILQKPDGTTVDITKPIAKPAEVPSGGIPPALSPAIEDRLKSIEAKVSATPDWLNQLQVILNSDAGKQIIQIATDWFQKQLNPPNPNPKPNPNPAPNPTPNPQPNPQPPIPNPQPTPAPVTTLKLSVTDSTGLAMASSSVPSGKLLAIKLEGYSNGQITWRKKMTGDVQFMDNGNQTASVVLGANGEVDLVVTDFGSSQQVEVRVTALNAPRPPPVPDVVPDGGADTNPVKSRKLFIAIVEDAQNRSPDTAIVMSAMGLWNGFREKGHDWRFYDIATTESKGKLAVVAAGALQPALVIRDLSTNELLTSVALPKTTKEIAAVVAKWSGA